MSDNPKEQEKQKGPAPLPLENKKKKNPYGRNGKKMRIFPKVMQMYEEEYSFDAICEECNICVSTLRRWLRDAGCPPKKNRWAANPKPWNDDKSKTPVNIFDGNEKHKNKQALEAFAEQSYANETERVDSIAAAQITPADQYQSYMASNAVRLMRDGLKDMRPPSNVREMEVLDKIARKHFGLDDKQNNGASSLSIDINILNDVASASRKRKASQTINVD